MEIKYEFGDLLKRKDLDVIAQQANCFNTMGAGIAAQIKSQYYEAYALDQKTIKGDKNKLGTFNITKNTTPKVANLYSQYHYYPRDKVHTDYNALTSSLDKLLIFMTENNLHSIGLPYKIGCGLAGGDWKIVNKIIEDAANKYDKIQFYIVNFNYIQ